MLRGLWQRRVLLVLARGRPLVGVLGALGPPRRPPRRGAAMAVQEPVGDLIDHVDARASQAAEAGEDAISELAQCPGQMAAGIPFQVAPLPFLAVQFWAVASEPDDMEPGRPLLQGV